MVQDYLKVVVDWPIWPMLVAVQDNWAVVQVQDNSRIVEVALDDRTMKLC